MYSTTLKKIVKPCVSKNLSISSLRKFCIHAHTDPNSRTPLSQSYRNSWPDVSSELPIIELELPKRTVSENVLTFKLTSTFDHGVAIFYPHMQMSPVDCKVSLYVRLCNNKNIQILNRLIFTSLK